MELWNKMPCLQAFWMSRQPVEVKAANGTHKKGHFGGEANKRISSSIAYWRKIRSSWEQLPALTGPTVLFDAWCQGLLDVNLIDSSRTYDLCVWLREQAIKDANGHAAVKPDLLLTNWKLTKSRKKWGNLFIIFSITSQNQRALPNSHSASQSTGNWVRTNRKVFQQSSKLAIESSLE